MQSRMTLVAVFLIILGLTGQAVGGGKPDTVRTVFTVEGMHCGGCSSTITATLERVVGVVEASADHDKGIAEAVYNPRKVEADDLKAEIEKLGYTVTAMKTETVES